LFLPIAQEKERQMGSIAFLLDFFLKSLFNILKFIYKKYFC